MTNATFEDRIAAIVAENVDATRDVADALLARIVAGGKPGSSVVSVLDEADLDALRRTTGILLAFTALGAETGMVPDFQREARTAMAVLYGLIDEAALRLMQKQLETT